MTGYPEEALVGQNWNVLFCGDEPKGGTPAHFPLMPLSNSL